MEILHIVYFSSPFVLVAVCSLGGFIVKACRKPLSALVSWLITCGAKQIHTNQQGYHHHHIQEQTRVSFVSQNKSLSHLFQYVCAFIKNFLDCIVASVTNQTFIDV